MTKIINKFPMGWEVVSMDDCVNDTAPICYGILKPGTHTLGGVPVVRVRDFNGSKIDTSKILKTTPQIHAQYKRSVLKEGDLILTIRGSTGDVLVTPTELCGGNITQDTARIRVKSTFHSSFVKFVIQGSNVQQQIRLHTIGQAVKGINIGEVRKLHFGLPEYPEQEKIAEILSTWDRAIEQAQKLIAAKQRRKQALMQQLLTGRKRLPKFEGDWVLHRLGKLFSNRVERNHNELPLLSVTGNRGIIPRDQLAKKDSSNSDKSKYLRIVPGDIGYNTMRMWQGVSALSQHEGIISPAYTICTPGQAVSGRFTAHLFKLPEVVHLFWRNSQGLVDDTLSLKFHNFELINLRFPTFPEQEAIANILDECNTELGELEKFKATIEQQKRGLMQQLLTGKTRVTVGERT